MLEISRKFLSNIKISNANESTTNSVKQLVSILENKYKPLLESKLDAINITSHSNLKRLMFKISSNNLLENTDELLIQNAQKEMEHLSDEIISLKNDNNNLLLDCEKWKEEALKKEQFQVPIPSVMALASSDGINSIVLQLIDSMKLVQELESANLELKNVNTELNVLKKVSY